MFGYFPRSNFFFPSTCSFFALFLAYTTPANAQQIRPPAAKGGIAELSAKGPQRRQGNLFIADDDVDIHYAGQRLRADHIEYNDQTTEALARGHVQYDFENQHLEADEAHYNVGTGRGTFTHVRGTLKSSAGLIPLYSSRIIRSISKPIWWRDLATISTSFTKRGSPCAIPVIQMAILCAARARACRKTMAIVNANFRLFRVPLIWMPYATAPAGPKIRESGFLVPVAGKQHQQGLRLR